MTYVEFGKKYNKNVVKFWNYTTFLLTKLDKMCKMEM